MFDDLDLTLRAILDDPAVPPSMAGIDVSFKAPDKSFNPAVATLDLFLNGVRENRVLRDPVPIVELVGGSYVSRTPPLRIDCDYLVTAWSKKTDAAGVAEEGLILANALLKLSRFPTIPVGYLRNALVGQPFPVQMWIGQADDSRSLGEFWSALGVSPRASFRVTVTIAMDVAVSVAEGPPVITKELNLDDDFDPATAGESVFAIGGVVRDAAGAAVADVVVTIDGARPTTTGADGRFLISGLAAGHYTLRATGPGHVPTDTAITVPAAALNAYDIAIPP